jgi:RES domain
VSKLPAPPAVEQLRGTAPEILALRQGALLWRIYFRGGRHPSGWSSFRSFGPAERRFDHHLPPPRNQDRAIYYAASEPVTCVAEVFQGHRRIEVLTDLPWLVGLRLVGDLRLLDLTGRWPTRAGASMAIHSGPRSRARAWSRAMYEAFPEVHGLLCCSSMDANRHTVALYERARGAMPRRPELHRALSDPGLEPFLQDAARALGYGLG